ncbi:MAG: glycosyltransferase [Planctomycetota bacterium]
MTPEKSVPQPTFQAEQQRRRRAEARAEALETELRFCQAELRRRREEVRYQLGDALVRALRPSLDTLKLPARLWRLLCLGWQRRRQRRQALAAEEHAGPGTPLPPRSPRATRCGEEGLGEGRERSSVQVPTAARPAQDTSTDVGAVPAGPAFDPVPLVSEPFGRAPPELRRGHDLRIAAVTDEFSWWAWQFEADVYTFTPGSWREMLEEQPPHLLLIESAWAGFGDTWRFQVRNLGLRPEIVPRYALPEVVAWCRARGIPTAFYNKEDPPNFAHFIDAARLFDFVFTSDADCLPAYRRQLGHERVFALPFAAQPRLHNPVWAGPRDGAVAFAGTWYRERHARRQDAAPAILRPALEFGLHIYDRMAASDDPQYEWPAAYRPALRGRLSYARMLTAYKRYKVFLNINSVADSPTMFARRVFELLACGTPVISSPSRGIVELLGEDIVLLSADEATTRRHLERLLGDEEYRERLSLRGQRRVFAEHTYAHRLAAILDTVGLRPAAEILPVITMLAAVANEDDLRGAWENYRRQSYRRKRLLVCAVPSAAVAGLERVAGGNSAVAAVVAEEVSWSRAYAAAVARCREGHVAAVHPRHFYGPDYLTDYAHAILYAAAPAIGKASYYGLAADGNLHVMNPGRECRVAASIQPWTLCVPVGLVATLAERLDHAATPDAWWAALLTHIAPAYSTDRFNYVGGAATTRVSAETASAVVV